jgi:hypothetical protein
MRALRKTVKWHMVDSAVISIDIVIQEPVAPETPRQEKAGRWAL